MSTPAYQHNKGDQPDKVVAWRKAYERGIAGDLCDRIVQVRDPPEELLATLLAPSPPYRHKLTRRQQEVLFLISVGRNKAQVAASLEISLETVKSLVKTINQKLGARNPTQAVAIGLRTFEII